MKRRLNLFFISLTLLGMLMPALSGQATDESAGERVSKLTVGTINQVKDTNIYDYYFGIFCQELSHQSVVRFDSNGDIAPELATSWETSDLKRWVFHIRDDARWHDGVPVTAQDIKFTVDYNLDKDTAAKSYLGSVESVEAPDNVTVVINLKSPDYNFLTDVAVVKIIPEHIFEKVEDPKTFDGKDGTIGCGPYKFAGFDKDAGILTYQVNDDYWGGKASIDTIEIKMYSNPDSLMMAFEKGEVDLPYYYSKGISYYYVANLIGDKDIGISVAPELGITNVLWFNTAKHPFDQKEFRQALSYAVNYEEMKNLFTGGYGSLPSAGWVPNGTLYYTDTRALAYDLNKSKSMLDDLGMKDVTGDGFRELPDGSSFKPSLLARSDLPDSARTAEMLKKYFAEVGIDVTLDMADKSTHGDVLDSQKTHEMALAGTTFWGMTMGEGYGSGYVDTRYYGWSMVDDSRYQSLVDQLGSVQEKEKRKELASEIQNYYADEMPQFTIYSMNIIQPYNAQYAGWEINPLHGIISYGTLFNLHKA